MCGRQEEQDLGGECIVMGSVDRAHKWTFFVSQCMNDRNHGILLGFKRYLARKTATRKELRYRCVSTKNWLTALVCKYLLWLSDKMDPATSDSGVPDPVQGPVPIRVPVQRVQVQGAHQKARRGKGECILPC